MKSFVLLSSAALATLLAVTPASAGDFDSNGDFSFDPAAIATIDFEKVPVRFLPKEADASCKFPQYALAKGKDALRGDHWVHVKVAPRCSERFVVKLPKKDASYKSRVWMRHGGVEAQFFAVYKEDAGLEDVSAELTPTGRTTSDGWVELESNDLSIAGKHVDAAYLKVTDYAGVAGVDIDAFEVIPSGTFAAQKACDGLGDPVCGPARMCIYGRCVDGATQVSVLPRAEIKDLVVDSLEKRLELFYGGRFSRATYLPRAMQKLEAMRKASSAWEFWSTWALAVHELHDWHTDTFGGLGYFFTPRSRLNVCFFEGDADLSHGAWPKDPRYLDILVSHAGPPETASGLKAGDRLVAVDGLHPLEWASSLGGSDWSFHVATDPDTFSDFAEEMGGPWWGGGALMLRYAHTFTVLRCDAETGTCADEPETIRISELANSFDGQDVACDNRPSYHFVDGNPDPTKHYVFGSFFRGAIADTLPEEKIFGMVWDTLDGEGEPTGPVNEAIRDAIADWKANARGVILDHRAGNGGTLDAATNVTALVRPPEPFAVIRMPMETSGFAGPEDKAAGKALFERYKKATPYSVGSHGYDPLLPVALVLHRDGSASDYLPFGMKGAPNVRLFGPHQTSGAFSTFIDFQFWGSVGLQFASGDTIAADGTSLIGHGVVPDEVVLPKQSDLLAGKDTLFEAALAWVRTRLKP